MKIIDTVGYMVQNLTLSTIVGDDNCGDKASGNLLYASTDMVGQLG